jgi:hypothetical protein
MKLHTVPPPAAGMGGTLLVRPDGRVKGPFTATGP